MFPAIEFALNQAVALHQEGKLVQAQQAYEKILAADRDAARSDMSTSPLILSRDIERHKQLRNTMRARMEASPLMNARAMENELRQAWRNFAK